MRQQTIW